MLYRKIRKGTQQGDKNHNFKGWKTDLSQLIKMSPEYNNWRKQVYERDNYICQDCGYDKGKILEVHHIKPFAVLLGEFLQEYSQFSIAEDKEILARLAITYEPFWEIDNGKTLCKDCHLELRKETWNKIKGGAK